MNVLCVGGPLDGKSVDKMDGLPWFKEYEKMELPDYSNGILEAENIAVPELNHVIYNLESWCDEHGSKYYIYKASE